MAQQLKGFAISGGDEHDEVFLRIPAQSGYRVRDFGGRGDALDAGVESAGVLAADGDGEFSVSNGGALYGACGVYVEKRPGREPIDMRSAGTE
ncbi:hypothetical protein [Burkholderia cenocepacia]|uniref:hypothetical protein n=1 Tax=Burkholderia cenocepacia TaxID=95486 RepID=UPI002012CDA9|nr:hypothetical protein [Burkholderia cenocepacia]